MHKRFMIALICTLASFAWILPLQAQEEESDGAADMVLITPKDGQGAALEAAIRDYHLWVADKEGHFEYSWYAIESGPNTGKYIARSGDHNWEDFDAEFEWQDEAAEKFAADVMPLIAHVQRKVTVEIRELANWPESFAGYTHYQVEYWHIENGQYGKWRQGTEQIHSMLAEGGYTGHYGFFSTVSGGKGNEVALVQPMKGYADFAESDPSFFKIVSEALGGPEAFAEFMADWGSTFHIGHSMLVRYLPEASDYGNDE